MGYRMVFDSTLSKEVLDDERADGQVTVNMLMVIGSEWNSLAWALEGINTSTKSLAEMLEEQDERPKAGKERDECDK